MLYNVTDIRSTWFKRAEGEPAIYSESLLYYRIQQILNDAGYNIVKKPPAKDGHLTDAPYYLRDHKFKYCLHDEGYMLRSLTSLFNSFKELRLYYMELEN